jgi:hypothetical protein
MIIITKNEREWQKARRCAPLFAVIRLYRSGDKAIEAALKSLKPAREHVQDSTWEFFQEEEPVSQRRRRRGASA